MEPHPLPYTQPFAIDLLVDLRAHSYRPAAWAAFLAKSWHRSKEDIARNPCLTRSIARQTLALTGLATCLLAWHEHTRPSERRHRARVGQLALGLLLQQFFVLLHIGMTQQTGAAPHHRTLGIANCLSQTRGVCATLLCAMGEPHGAPYLVTLAIGAATDVLDGWLARRLGSVTRLGQMLDPMADTYFWSAATLIAVRRGGVAPWFGWLTFGRFTAPVIAGVYRYFWTLKPVDAHHTVWGKASGIALAGVLVLNALHMRVTRLPLQLLSVAMLVASALQVRRSLVPENTAKPSQ